MLTSVASPHKQRTRGTGVPPVGGAPRREPAHDAGTSTTRAGCLCHDAAVTTRSDQAPAPLAFDAAIFDMDGVLTETASVHSRAWKQMFDEFLRRRARERGEPYHEFTHAGDYLRYVDGKPRARGVEAFLESRGIRLPLGSADDPPEAETLCGLGNRKNELFNAIIASSGVQVFASTIALIEELRAAGVRVGLATSSRNSGLVLARTRTAPLFETVVDGVVSERLALRGKPQPDIFVTACRDLGARCERAIVIEDAVSGVQAGAQAGFGLVIGIAREDNAGALRENGADVVVRDLAELGLAEINRQVLLKAAAA